jgi:hypothetical protein
MCSINMIDFLNTKNGLVSDQGRCKKVLQPLAESKKKILSGTTKSK